MSKKILVTGGAGLIGRTVLYQLLSLDHDVFATQNRSVVEDCEPANLRDGDLESTEFCHEATKGIDVVIHCAATTSGAAVMAKSPLTHVTGNIVMNARLLEAAYRNGVKKFIWLSSTTGYPASNSALKESAMTVGEPYKAYFAVGHMKRYTEKLCELYTKHLNPAMQCVILRPSNIIGPGDKFDLDKCHVVPALIKKVCDGHDPLVIWGDGSEQRDILYVDDMADAIIKAIDYDGKELAFNIGCGGTASVKQLFEIIRKLAKADPKVEYDATKPTMIPFRAVNIELAWEELRWAPSTTLVGALQKTIDWYRGFDTHVD